MTKCSLLPPKDCVSNSVLKAAQQMVSDTVTRLLLLRKRPQTKHTQIVLDSVTLKRCHMQRNDRQTNMSSNQSKSENIHIAVKKGDQLLF